MHYGISSIYDIFEQSEHFLFNLMRFASFIFFFYISTNNRVAGSYKQLSQISFFVFSEQAKQTSF